MKPNLSLNPAQQVRELDLCVGDILQGKLTNGTDRITLIWVGHSTVVWSRLYKSFSGERGWEDIGEVPNYCEFHTFERDWVKISQAEIELEKIRELCAAAYQVVGAVGGPLEMLDNLSAAAAGAPLPHHPSAGIPWVPAAANRPKQSIFDTHANAEDAGY